MCIFEGYNRKLERERKNNQMNIYAQAVLTAHFIGSMFSDKVKVLTYEDIFESDTEEYKLKKLQQETAQLRELARKVNEQRRQSDGRRET